MRQIIENNKKMVIVKHNDEVLAEIVWNMTTNIYHTYCNYVEKTECKLNLKGKCYWGNSQQTVINRSWEYYEGQATISGSLYDIKAGIEDRIKQELKEKNGWGKMTASRNEVWKKAIEDSEEIKIVSFVLDAIRQNSRSKIELEYNK